MYVPIPVCEVLLIESDSAAKDTVLAALAERGCRVRSVALGAEGVALARELRPDLLILNLVLPDMAGAEVVRRMRALDGLAMVPAMFVSSEQYDPVHPESSAGVVLKPFLMTDLGAALDFAIAPSIKVTSNGHSAHV
jgi:DNA-binding response OmpR family regulator